MYNQYDVKRMMITRSSYESALKKLSLPAEILYDNRGYIHPEYILTDNEKESLFYWVRNESYFKRDSYKNNDKIVVDSDRSR